MTYLYLFTENLKLRNEPSHNFIFQVGPPFQYSATVQPILLEDSEVPASTSVVFAGWGQNEVNQ
jgi:hypothetical protein